jgi:hypothetical protein
MESNNRTKSGKKPGLIAIGTTFIFLMLLFASASFLTGCTSAGGPYKSGDYTYTTDGQTATITGYAGAGGAIIIPSMFGGYHVVAIGTDAFFEKINLISVTIPSSVKTIGGFAFDACTDLTSVHIGSNVTTIEGLAFGDCTALTAICQHQRSTV